MNKIKQIISKNFASFTYFFKQLRYRIFLLLTFNIIVGLLDGLGLSMFLPLLELINESNKVNGSNLGGLKVVINFFENIGIDLNLFTVLSLMVILFSFKGLVKFIASAYRAVIQQFFIRNLREQMLIAFNKLRYKFFVTSDVGRIQNTMSGEVERVSRAFQSYSQTMEQAVLVIVYVVFAYMADARFALLVTIGGLLTNFLYKIIYKKTKGASRIFTKDSHLYQGQIIQHVANFKYLKSTGFLKDYSRQLRKSINLIEHSRKKMGILNAILDAAREPLLIVVIACVILIQNRILNAPLGPILISLIFFYRSLTALVNMQNTWNRFLVVSGSLENVISFHEEIIKNKENNGKINITSFENCLLLENASFSYDNNLILHGINLQIAKNETVAFAGESGSGKTTLVNILAGLLPLDTGSFFIDGINSKDLNINSYQKNIGYITQEPVIFNDTIFNNVTFWAEPNEENLQRFNQAIRQAALNEFISNLPNNYQTLLGTNGVNLSGGQKQRISIARELYKEVEILIMDEATSALDTETEKVIQESIDRLKGQYTLIIVAHRLSTIRNANSIILVNNGQITHKGSFKHLMKFSKTFKRMVEMQEL